METPEDTLSRIIAEALAPEIDKNIQLQDRLMRMELALRMVRRYAMSDVMLPEAGAVRDWLRDWIDGVSWLDGPNQQKTHGPVGEPMIWPAFEPRVCDLLRFWGFDQTPDGYVYAKALVDAIDAGEPQGSA